MIPCPTNTASRLCVVVLSVLFAAACVWRVFHFPYRRDALLRAVPPDAVWAAEQPELSAAWRGMLGNPILRASLVAGGADDFEIGRLLAGTRTDKMLEALASRDTVLAYVPEGGGGSPAGPALIAASWVGYRAQFLRWRSLGRAMGRSASRHRLMSGVDLWTVLLARPGPPLFLSVAVVRGAIYACVSRDPYGVQHVVFRVNRSGEVAPFLRDIADAPPAAGFREQRGWLLWRRKTGPEIVRAEPVDYALSKFDTSGAVGALRIPAGALVVPPAPMPGGLDAMESLLGDSPCAFLTLTMKQMETVLRTFLDTDQATIRPLTATTPTNAPAFVCMLAGEESGHVMGLKVPGILAGCRTDMDPSNLHASVSETLDILNTKMNLKLIPRRRQHNEMSWVRIESTDSGIFASLREGESPAVAVKDGWLLVAGNENMLRAILDRPKYSAPPRWAALLRNGSSAPALWFDSAPATRALRDAVAVMTLTTIAGGDTATTRAKRDRLDRAKAWLQTAQNAGEGTVRLEPDTLWTTIRFEIREKSLNP